MGNETVQMVQDYLTVVSESQVRRIIDIEPLLARHPARSVISFLDNYYKDKEKTLKTLIAEDKTSSAINDTIVTMFRIYMAIKTIEEDGEEVKAA